VKTEEGLGRGGMDEAGRSEGGGDSGNGGGGQIWVDTALCSYISYVLVEFIATIARNRGTTTPRESY